MNNTVVRTISGVVYAAILISCILLNKFLFASLMVFCIVMAMHEFHRMTMGDEYVFSRILSIVTIVILFLLTFFAKAYDSIAYRYIILAFVPLFAVMVNSLYVKDKTDFGKFANIYTSMLYIGLPLTMTNLLTFPSGNEYTGILLLCFFAIICATDVGAYVFGMALGQKYGKKLFPSISPKKSWIGFWGGLLTAIVTGIVLKITGLLEFPIVHCLILSVIISISGVYGDLFESQWKRHYEIKDSGNLIPGHGGILDRLDSAMFAIPIGTVYLICLNLI